MNRRTWMVALPLSAALAVTFAAVADAEVAYRIEPIELPEGSNAWDVNNEGEVTGNLPSVLVGERQVETPILWRNGHYIELTRAIGNAGDSIGIGAINDRSVMIGVVLGETQARSFTFRRPRHRVDLPPRAFAEGINNRNEVFGAFFPEGSSIDQAFLWRKGEGITLLPVLPGEGEGTSNATGINDRGDVVGLSGPEPARAVIWSEGTAMALPLLPGANFGQGNAINNHRQVVGINLVDNVLRSFLWAEGELIELFPPGGCSIASPTAINDWGVIVGEAACDEGADVAATAWINTQPLRLDDLVAADDPLREQLRLRSAITINDRGWILAMATDRATGTQTRFVLLKPTRRVGALTGD